MTLINKVLCFLGWHRWDDERRGAGLNNSYCKACEKLIHHGVPYLRGKHYGREL